MYIVGGTSWKGLACLGIRMHMRAVVYDHLSVDLQWDGSPTIGYGKPVGPPRYLVPRLLSFPQAMDGIDVLLT